MPALDGIRAVSILGIMANHGGLGWAGGGLVSVNVFFVLSGFLITTLLMKEWVRTATIRLRAFWARRARRLLPALFVLLAAIGVYAVFFAPEGTGAQLRGDGLATLFYVANWHQIFTGQSYFVQVSPPSPLLHTWTLAIEEQFYLVWPLVVLATLKLTRSPKVLLAAAVLGALASAGWMAHLYHTGPDVDLTRLYFGTDTRAQDILTGAAMGILLYRRSPATGRSARAGLSLMALLAVAVFVVEWSRINSSPNVVYRGGFLLADLMVALVICGVTLAPRGLPARLLGLPPLAFVGRVSYGLYLWHWPVDLVVNEARTGLVGYSLFAVRSAIAFAIAVASWYLVESPIRERRFTNWRRWAWIPLGAVAASAVLVSGTAAAATVPILPSNAPERNAFYTFSFPADPGSVRVLFVGDSLAYYLAYDMSPYAASDGVTIGGRPEFGCGLAAVQPYNLHGTPTYSIAPCTQWPQWYLTDVDQLRPQVVVLTVGWWECMDRVYQGRWQHLGDPAFDAYETAQFEQAVRVLSSTGAKVAITTVPYFDTGEQLDGLPWDEDDPARVNVLNGIIEQVAGEHPGVVSVIPLNRYLDPRGRFTWTIEGKVVRLGDGVHTAPEAGPYLAPKILPQLASLGGGSGVASRPTRS
ncbi:MAG TPA: acyltransferase family protein [Acidimicrobiales bacterium]|nr:acyltransferase family protein [Acidimicrobiales bacterium]